MQPNRKAARAGMITAVALAASMLAGTSWASSQVPSQQKERCVTSLEAKPNVDPGVERKPRCPLAVRYVPRMEAERADLERNEATLRPAGRRA